MCTREGAAGRRKCEREGKVCTHSKCWMGIASGWLALRAGGKGSALAPIGKRIDVSR